MVPCAKCKCQASEGHDLRFITIHYNNPLKSEIAFVITLYRLTHAQPDDPTITLKVVKIIK